MPKLLDVKNLSVSFRQDGRTVNAVKNISFEINRQETVAIVGESGSGKSVSALSTVKLLPESAQVSGSVKFEGTELIDASFETLKDIRGNRISFIFQEPMTSLNPLHTLDKQIGESLRIHQGITGSKARQRTIELLEQTGIDQPESRLKCYPHLFSGGQRQRIMIAMALANNPSLLIADEPTTALDVTIQAQILQLLADLKENIGMGLLFITHDLNIVEGIADRVLVMKEGEIVESASKKKIFSQPEHPYTQALLAAEPKGILSASKKKSKNILDVVNLKVWFPIKRGLLRNTVGYVKAVNDATFAIKQGETLGIVGESGSGKTTIALALLRLIASEGSISFNNNRLDQLPKNVVRKFRRHMQIVFQDPYGSLSPRMTVEQIVSEGLRIHKSISAQERKELTINILKEVGLSEEFLERYPHEFSGGQRQRIAIARTMVLEPELILLDEPTSALDRTVQAQIVELLLKFQADKNLTYLFISHDLRMVKALSHNILVMYQGNVIESGPTQAVFNEPKTDYTKRLLAAAFQNI
ncbi:MAG: ABC transporter ATP-binding protein [Rhodobacteraceae bacterium]|nr:ABC transporter ATP-binding protein [Paracoccaceae bacterium]